MPTSSNETRIAAIEVRGEMTALFQFPLPPEIICEGVAGSGKSVAACYLDFLICQKYPGARILMARKTRESMTQTILVTWEKVLEMCGCTEVYSSMRRANRSSYVFPNGSEVACIGFDNTERIKSGEFDFVHANEANELTQEEWEIALSRLRHPVASFKTAIAECNPTFPDHWLNRRPHQNRLDEYGRVMRDALGNPLPKMVRIVTKHVDNPAYYTQEGKLTPAGRDYMTKLHALTGVQRDRLLLGLWVAQEGTVFADTWDATVHCITEPKYPDGQSIMRWHVAGMDWGGRDPGVLQVWGVDSERRMYRVREIYWTQQDYSWWGWQLKCAHRDFSLRATIADSSNPSAIKEVSRKAKVTITPAQKGPGSIETGIRLIEERLKRQLDGRPAIYFCKNAVGHYDVKGRWIPGVDETLLEANHPTCGEQEMTRYHYHKTSEGKPIREEPVDMWNHSVDSLRYCLPYINSHNHQPRLKPEIAVHGSRNYDDTFLRSM